MGHDVQRVEDLLRAFALSVRSRRQELGLSQEELAHRSRLHRTYISDIERGTRNVALVNIVRLAEALDVNPGDLISGLGKKTKQVPSDIALAEQDIERA